MTFLHTTFKNGLRTALGLALWLAAPAWAGEVHFGEGNVLHGEIASYHEGVLVMSTDYAKRIKIPIEQIQTLTTEEIATVELKTGSILKGQFVTRPDGSMGILLDPLKETVSLTWDEIKYINKKPGKWKGNFFAGGNIQSGNVEFTSISLGGEAKRDWEHDRFSMRAIHNYAEENGQISSRNTFGAFKFDHFFTTSFYTLLSTELLKDEFKNLNLRTTIGGGMGYQIWQNDTKNLEFEASLVYFSEDTRVGKDENFIAGRFSSNFMYQIFENLSFSNYLLYYPNLGQVSEYRVRNQASLDTHLTENWSFRLTHILDHNSNPSPGIKKTDEIFIFSLKYNFGD